MKVCFQLIDLLDCFDRLLLRRFKQRYDKFQILHNDFRFYNWILSPVSFIMILGAIGYSIWHFTGSESFTKSLSTYISVERERRIECEF